MEMNTLIIYFIRGEGGEYPLYLAIHSIPANTSAANELLIHNGATKDNNKAKQLLEIISPINKH